MSILTLRPITSPAAYPNSVSARVAEGLDDAALVDRDDRVGRGSRIERSRASRSSIIDCACFISVKSREISRIDSGISTGWPMSRPLALDDQTAAVLMGMLQLALPFAPLPQFGLDLRPRHGEFRGRSSWESRPMASSADHP